MILIHKIKVVIGVLIFCVTYTRCNAQIKQAVFAINGLTCSQCSFGVEKSIKKLECVGEVRMDLNKNIATIQAHEDYTLNLNLIAQKIEDAGFSVGEVYFEMQESLIFDSIYLKNDVMIDKKWCLVKNNQLQPSASSRVKLWAWVSKKYTPKNIRKAWLANVNQGSCNLLDKNIEAWLIPLKLDE